MKFIDKNGLVHDSYVCSLISNLPFKKLSFLNPVSLLSKRNRGDESDSIIDVYDYDEIYECDFDDEDDDMKIPDEKGGKVDDSDLFIPGTTPKVPRNKMDTIEIDYGENQLLLKDEDENVINITKLSSEMMDTLSADELINLVYYIKDDTKKMKGKNDN